MTMKLHLTLLSVLVSLPVLCEDLIVSDLTGENLSDQLPVVTTSQIADSITTTGWDMGAGFAPFSGFDDRIAVRLPGAAEDPSTLSDSIARGEYFTITLLPNEPIDLAGQRMAFGVTRASWFAARRYAVFTSIDGFAEEDVLFTSNEIPNGTEEEVALSFIFANSSAFENLTEPIEIRIYAFAANYSSHVTSLSAFSITDPGPTYTLNLTAGEGGDATASPDGQVFTENSELVLTANPSEGYRFLRWSGTQESEINPIHVTMDRDHSLTALFEPDESGGMGVGTNLSQVVSWSTGRPFTDLMKYARAWVGQYNGGQTQGIPAGPQGYPIEVPFDFEGQSHYTARALLPHFTGGDHTLSFEGSGTIRFSNGPADGTVNYPGNGPVSTHTVPLNAPSGAALLLHIVASDASDPVRNIQLHLPGFDETTTFHPEYLATLESFSVLRFMDWARTNSNPVTTWEERNTPDYYTQGVTVEDSPGVAFEYMIQLANELQKTPWFCIPHLADDNYVTEAARLIRDTLDPNLSFYLEYSNETWNSAPAFVQTYYARNQGESLGLHENPVDAGHLFSVMRSAQIWQIFQNEFAVSDDPSRIIKTMASWSARDEISELRLNALADPAINPTGIAADVLAIAPYFGGGIGVDELAQNGYPTAEEMVGIRSLAELAETRLQVRDQKRLARIAGVELVCYEGGQHWVGANAAQNDETLTAILQAANRDSAMETRYTEYLNMLEEEGVAMFANFQHMEGWSRYGSWGIWEYQGQPLEDAPKARAVLNWIADNVTAPETAFSLWAGELGVDPSAGLTSDLESDSVPLLAEYGFNLDPVSTDFHTLSSGNGLSGMPRITFEWDPDLPTQGRLVVEYLRRRGDPLLSYLVEFSDSVADLDWETSTEIGTVQIIDDTWERVVVRDDTTSASAINRFGRVRLEYGTP